MIKREGEASASASGSGNGSGAGFTPAAFGSYAFTESEADRISDMLDRKLAKDDLSTRAGPGNSRLTYVEAHKLIELANGIFTFNGWSSAVTDITVDFCDEVGGRYNVGVSAIVRIALKDGCFHEDIGYGTCKNLSDKGQALEKAKKESVTDAHKRAFRMFGSALGNCVYDKSYLSDVEKGKGATERVMAGGKRKREPTSVPPSPTPSASASSPLPVPVPSGSTATPSAPSSVSPYPAPPSPALPVLPVTPVRPALAVGPANGMIAAPTARTPPPAMGNPIGAGAGTSPATAIATTSAPVAVPSAAHHSPAVSSSSHAHASLLSPVPTASSVALPGNNQFNKSPTRPQAFTPRPAVSSVGTASPQHPAQQLQSAQHFAPRPMSSRALQQQNAGLQFASPPPTAQFGSSNPSASPQKPPPIIYPPGMQPTAPAVLAHVGAPLPLEPQSQPQVQQFAVPASRHPLASPPISAGPAGPASLSPPIAVAHTALPHAQSPDEFGDPGLDGSTFDTLEADSKRQRTEAPPQAVAFQSAASAISAFRR